jgi:hypothetical protein
MARDSSATQPYGVYIEPFSRMTAPGLIEPLQNADNHRERCRHALLPDLAGRELR